MEKKESSYHGLPSSLYLTRPRVDHMASKDIISSNEDYVNEYHGRVPPISFMSRLSMAETRYLLVLSRSTRVLVVVDGSRIV